MIGEQALIRGSREQLPTAGRESPESGWWECMALGTTLMGRRAAPFLPTTLRRVIILYLEEGLNGVHSL
jgi:hypothetical protein